MDQQAHPFFSNGSISGTRSYLGGGASVFTIDASYALGTPIAASGILTGKTLSGLGLSTTSGLLGTWTFNSNPSETIQLWAGPAASGAGSTAAAFSFSRRLRSRLRAGSPSPQA